MAENNHAKLPGAVNLEMKCLVFLRLDNIVLVDAGSYLKKFFLMVDHLGRAPLKLYRPRWSFIIGPS